MTENTPKNTEKRKKPDHSGLEVSWEHVRPDEADIRIQRAFEMLLKDGTIDRTRNNFYHEK